MKNEEKKYELIKFKDEAFSLDVKVSFEDNTVWLSAKDMAILFERDYKTILKHINNLYNEQKVNADNLHSKSQKMRLTGNNKPTQYFNLNVVISVGCRVKSNRTVKFEKWANDLLNQKSLNNYEIQNNGQFSQLIKFTYNNEVSIDVTVSPEEETVWLTQKDMSILFDTTVSNINIHIKNILGENELDSSVVKDYLITATDGKVYQTLIYNLDMIIAVGYRINSRRGTQFRKWATSVLKQYLIKGSAINEERCLTCTSNLLSLQNEVKAIESKISCLEDKVNIENSKIFYQGEILDAYTFIRKLFFLAKEEIVIVDYYADKFLLSMLSDIKVDIIIITSTSSYLNKEIIPGNITIIKNDDIHGRYLFIDNQGYIIDNSFNNIGKKRILMMKLDDSKEVLLKGII